MASTKDDVNTHAEGWMRERGQPHVCAGTRPESSVIGSWCRPILAPPP